MQGKKASKLVKSFRKRALNCWHLGNGAAGFGETVRNTIFSVALRRLFEREKNWIWRFALIFCFFLIKQKEEEKMIEFLRKP